MDLLRIMFFVLIILSNYTVITYGVYIVLTLMEKFLRYFIDDTIQKND